MSLHVEQHAVRPFWCQPPTALLAARSSLSVCLL
jgi:hypothetical protein